MQLIAVFARVRGGKACAWPWRNWFETNTWALVFWLALSGAQANAAAPTLVAPMSRLSQVEISTQPNARAGPPLLRLQGDAYAGQVVRLMQNGMVFFEQQLPEGSFAIDNVVPIHPSMPVNLQLQSPSWPEEKADLPLALMQSRTVFSRRPELMTPISIISVPPSAPPAPPGNNDDMEFETDFLRGSAFRKMDAAAIKKLGQVRPGRVDADVFRNDAIVAKANVLFTEPPGGGQARACISPELFMQLGIKPEQISPAGQKLLQNRPAAGNSGQTAANHCLYIEQWVSGTSAQYDTSELRLSLTIPQAFLVRQSRTSVPPGMLTRGENAGFVNYSLNHFESQTVSSDFLNLNSGINLQGWQVRHTSYLSQNNNAGSGSTQQYVPGETFVRRPLIDWQSTLALGEIASQSPIVGSLPVRGFRLASEEGLMSEDERSYRPVIRGVARTNARVRVLQNGAVFWEQTVPPGPYEFSDINPPSGVGNLTVTQTETDGSIETFLVPYSMSANKLNPGSSRYSLAAGHFRTSSGVSNTPVVQAFLRYGLNNLITPGVELLATDNYQNAGLQMAFNNPWGSVAFNRLQSQGQGVGSVYAAGHSHSINYSAPAWGPLQMYLGVNEQSLGYVSPLSALTDSSLNPYNPLSMKNSIYLNMGLNLKSRGTLSLSVSEQNTWTDNQQSHQYRLSYGTTIRHMGFSVYLSQTTYANGTPTVETMGFSATLPLGFFDSQGGLRYSQNQTGSATPTQSLSAYGSALQNNALSYSLTQSKTGEQSSTNASFNYQYAYGNLGLNLSGWDKSNNQMVGFSASGGLVAHSGGLIMSPSVGTTFAIVELPNGQGAGLMGSQARINRSGFGVLPSLSPYYLNDVQISLEGAPSELEVSNPGQRVAPVEGSIVRLKFNATVGRPLLVVLQTSSGVRVPIGSSVTDEQGNDIGTVGQGGRALVRVQKGSGRFKVQWGDKPDESCYSAYALTDDKSTNASGFAQLRLRCEVITMFGNPVQSSP